MRAHAGGDEARVDLMRAQGVQGFGGMDARACALPLESGAKVADTGNRCAHGPRLSRPHKHGKAQIEAQSLKTGCFGASVCWPCCCLEGCWGWFGVLAMARVL